VSYYDDVFNASQANESVDSGYARLTRQQFADQRERYFPFEEQAFEMFADPARRQAYRDEGIGITNRAVESAFDAAESRIETTRSRTNQDFDERQGRINERRSSLAKSVAGITARNDTRRYMDQREIDLIGG